MTSRGGWRALPVLRVLWVLGADRLLRISAAIGLVVAMLWVVGNALPLTGGPAAWVHDSGNYYAAGERLNAGHSLYAYGPGDRHTLELLFGLPSPYLYPPLIGVLFRPIAAVLPFDPVVVVFWASGMVTFLAFLGWLLLRGSTAAAIGVLVLLVPLAETAWSGNVSTFITIGITLATIALLRDARGGRLAGAVIGFTTVLKLSPAFLGWWLLVTQRWSALRVAVAVGAVSLLVSVLGAGIDAHFQFLSISSEVARQGGMQASLVGILRAFDAPPDLMPVVAPVVSVCGVVAVWLLRRDERAAWAVAIVTGALASPIFNLTNVTMLLAAFVAFDGRLVRPAAMDARALA